MGIAFFII